jgi:hypothetical protein
MAANGSGVVQVHVRQDRIHAGVRKGSSAVCQVIFDVGKLDQVLASNFQHFRRVIDQVDLGDQRPDLGNEPGPGADVGSNGLRMKGGSFQGRCAGCLH